MLADNECSHAIKKLNDIRDAVAADAERVTPDRHVDGFLQQKI